MHNRAEVTSLGNNINMFVVYMFMYQFGCSFPLCVPGSTFSECNLVFFSLQQFIMTLNPSSRGQRFA